MQLYKTYLVGAQSNENVDVTLFAANDTTVGDSVRAYIFDDFINLYTIGELQTEIK